MFKRPLIVIAAAIVLIAAVIFIYRYQILQYTAETLIRKNLPEYIHIDKIKFDFAAGGVHIDGFRVSNPPGFSGKYLLVIDKVTCLYKLRSRNVMDGLELSDPVLTRAVLNIERLPNGAVNLVEEQALITKNASTNLSPKEGAGVRAGESGVSKPGRSPLPGAIKLPQSFRIDDAKVSFSDSMGGGNPSVITVENIDTAVAIKFDELCANILYISATGGGYLNGAKEQTINWVVGLDPSAPKLTMSSRLDIRNAEILTFYRYYDRYSPFVFKAGRFSGLLIFDFDNGNIGSSDELRLSGLKFFVKPGYENAQFWETTVPDLVKYFTSPYGEVIFDFKIKGDMANPQFYLGPKSKAALVSMAVDKISEAIQKGSSQGSGAPKNDIDKAKEYIDLFKNLMKK